MAEPKNSDQAHQKPEDRMVRNLLYGQPSYLRFLLQVLKDSRSYARYTRLRALFSPTLWVVRILRWVRILLRVLETSAVLVVAAAFFVLLFPIFLLLVLGLGIAVVRERQRANRRIRPLLSGRRVLVLFGGTAIPASLVSQYTVLLVGEMDPVRAPASVALHRSDGVILLREHYFFYLRRHLFFHAARVALLF